MKRINKYITTINFVSFFQVGGIGAILTVPVFLLNKYLKVILSKLFESGFRADDFQQPLFLELAWFFFLFLGMYMILISNLLKKKRLGRKKFFSY